MLPPPDLAFLTTSCLSDVDGLRIPTTSVVVVRGVNGQLLLLEQHPSRHIQLMEVVTLYQGDEAIGVLGIGGISASLQPSGPPFVVGGLEFK